MTAEDERALVSKAVRGDTEAYAALLHFIVGGID